MLEKGSPRLLVPLRKMNQVFGLPVDSCDLYISRKTVKLSLTMFGSFVVLVAAIYSITAIKKKKLKCKTRDVRVLFVAFEKPPQPELVGGFKPKANKYLVNWHSLVFSKKPWFPQRSGYKICTRQFRNT